MLVSTRPAGSPVHLYFQNPTQQLITREHEQQSRRGTHAWADARNLDAQRPQSLVAGPRVSPQAPLAATVGWNQAQGINTCFPDHGGQTGSLQP